MLFTPLELKDAYVVDVRRYEDNRGFFAQTWGLDVFGAQGLETQIVRMNLSYNYTRGTLRGMHFQREPYAETKLVRCVRGAIYDVIIDLRPQSPSYRRWAGVELTAENRRALYVPAGFAHGFQTLVDDAEVLYQVSQIYAPEAEGGVRYNDPAFEIRWPLPPGEMSQKDQLWPDFVS
jgi:dTDP-4-dehydrorhamnose 3,5-epimerase